MEPTQRFTKTRSCISCTVVVVWVCVCVGFVMRGCFDSSVDVLVICVIEFTVLYCLYCVFVLFRLCIFTLICFVCASVRASVTE
jgi:uncharacterized Tic20 family protein